MKVLKKKSLSVVEVYVVFSICMVIGYLTYLMLINNFIFLNLPAALN